MRAATTFLVFRRLPAPGFQPSGIGSFPPRRSTGKAHRARGRQAAYAKVPLATAANDAGLIAQTLQAAGFDVIGARDLDADTLRKSFRDFIQKAEASGPGTVAMVYLAGYGVQLAGENYSFRSIPRSARHRYPDRGHADQRLHSPARSASLEGQRDRAGCGAAAALHRRRTADRRRPFAGRARKRIC